MLVRTIRREVFFPTYFNLTMKNRLFLSIFIAALAGGVMLSGCSKNSKTSEADSAATVNAGVSGSASFIFNRGNTPVPSIQFQAPSSNGGLAWVQFDSISTPTAPLASMSDTLLTNVGAGFQVVMCYANSAGNYAPPVTVLPTSGTLSLNPGTSGMMVAMYKNTPRDTMWTPFDSVTITSPNGAPTNLGSPFYITGIGPPTPTPYTIAFKSKDGTKSASVVVIVTSTALTPVLPPH